VSEPARPFGRLFPAAVAWPTFVFLCGH
jgi:hypothetical protein